MRIGIALLRTRAGIATGDIASIDTLATQFAENRIQVTLLSPRLNFRCQYRQQEYISTEWEDTRILSNIARYVRAARRLSKDVDLLECHLLFPSFAFIGDLISLGNDTPIVVNFGIPLIDPWREIGVHLSEERLWYLSRLVVNNQLGARLARFTCDTYVISSHYQRQQLLALGVEKTKIAVIPNCVDVRCYRKTDRDTARSSLGLPADDSLVVYVGHPTPPKGILFLVGAFPQVLSQYPRCKLVLALTQTAGIQKKLAACIDRLGLDRHVLWLNRVNVPQLLSAADVLILPYVASFGTHMFPSMMLEALSVGVPLVSSDLPIIREVITDGQTGLLAPLGDSAAIAERILRLLADADLRESMVAAQREVARERFDARVAAKELLHLYERVIDEKRQGRG